MAENTKQLKQKIKSVKSLQKITKAMEMIARSKMKKAIDSALSTRIYATLALELLVNVSADVFHRNVFLRKGESGEKTLVVYIASDKGLCGGYNAQVFRAAKKYFASRHHKSQETDFVVIGKYAHLHATKLNGQILKTFNYSKSFFRFSDGAEIYDLVLSLYAKGGYKKAVIIYTNYLSIFSREPIVKELLPISPKSLKNMIEHLGSTEDDIVIHSLKHKEFAEYIYEPSKEEVLDTVVPKLVSIQIYQSILESRASEESGRMVAMKSASENGEKIGKELEVVYNRARQASITKEIIEIASATEAMV